MKRQTTRRLALAIPSKGQLYESTLQFLAACELPVQRGGQGREYVGRLGGIDGVEALFLRAEEIPERVERGGVQLGVTGEDLHREYGDGRHLSCVLLPKLGYGGARLVVAVPRVWIDVASMADLEEVALIYRQRRGRCLRVATKFPRLTRAFFAEHGIADYMIVQSGGATEGAPASGVADIIVDLSSTGATLAQNHLKEISGGTLVDSQACLIASTRSTDWDGEALHALRQVVEMIEGRLRAKSSKVVQFSALRSQAARIAAELEVRFHCEAHDGARAAWGQTYGSPAADAPVAVTAICPSPALYSVILYLREAGCLEITTSRPDFIFSKPSEAVEGFRKLLRHLHEDQKSPLNTGGG